LVIVAGFFKNLTMLGPVRLQDRKQLGLVDLDFLPPLFLLS